MLFDVICWDVFGFENWNDFRNYEIGYWNIYDLIMKFI